MTMKAMKAVQRATLVSLCLGLGGGCYVSSHPDVKLGVPHVQQTLPDTGGCGLACVEMWILYDGAPYQTQQDLIDWLGGSIGQCYQGTSWDDIALAVRTFTYTGSDCTWEANFNTAYEAHAAKQVQSIDNRVPVIVATMRGQHAEVLNGGKWHSQSGGYRMWDHVYLHDPNRPTGNRFLSGFDYINEICAVRIGGSSGYCVHALSSGSIFGWESGLSAADDTLRVRGDARRNEGWD